jgi:hypothetical protein
MRLKSLGPCKGAKRPELLPWSIHVELHEGCTRRCWFCGINNYKGKEKDRAKATSCHSMDLGLLRKVFTELNDWLGRIRVEINDHGEPTLHPAWMQAINTMSSSFPLASLQAQTNCDPWIWRARDFIEESFGQGLDTLCLNCYNLETYDFFIDKLPQWGIPFIDYYHNNPNNISANAYYKKGKGPGRVIVWKDLSTMNLSKEVYQLKKINKSIHNVGGNVSQDLIYKMTGTPPTPVPTKHRCSKVHREIVLSWDGKVPICCLDWRDLTVMGDCNTQDIRQIWYSHKWEVVRQALYDRKRRLLMPCAECASPTTRTGLDKNPGLVLTDARIMKVLEGSK